MNSGTCKLTKILTERFKRYLNREDIPENEKKADESNDYDLYSIFDKNYVLRTE